MMGKPENCVDKDEKIHQISEVGEKVGGQMKQTIELPCSLGDDIYYCCENSGVVEINVQKAGVREITITKKGIKISDGEMDGSDFIGTAYAHLTHEDAVQYVKNHLPDHYVIDRVANPSKEVLAVVCGPGTEPIRIKVPLTLETIQSYVGYSFNHELDANGMVGLTDKDAKRKNKPFNRAALDADGNIVDIIFGTLMILQTTIDKNGFRTFVNVEFEDSCEHCAFWDDDGWCFREKRHPYSKAAYESPCEHYKKQSKNEEEFL